MSVESFHNGFPADETFVENMSLAREFGNSSPVGFMANIYINKGANGLSKTSSEWIRTIREGTAETDKEYHDSLMLNQAAIYFGITLKCIEEIIVEGSYDQNYYNSILENAFVGAPIDAKPFLEPYEEKVDDWTRHNLKEIALDDLSFGSFFEYDEDFQKLPIRLKTFLARSGTKQHIERFILPNYLERVKLLIDSNRKRVIEKENQEFI